MLSRQSGWENLGGAKVAPADATFGCDVWGAFGQINSISWSPRAQSGAGLQSEQPMDLTRHLGRRISGSFRDQRDNFLHGVTDLQSVESVGLGRQIDRVRDF